MSTDKNGLRYPWADPPTEGAAIEVADGVLWFRMPLPMVLDHVNIYALADEDGWTIVDTGFDTGRGRAIWDVLRAGPLAGRRINRGGGSVHRSAMWCGVVQKLRQRTSTAYGMVVRYVSSKYLRLTTHSQPVLADLPVLTYSYTVLVPYLKVLQL